jgi:hypothetical protein
MLPNPQQCHALASEWINAFNHSLTAAPQSPDAAAHLFLADSYWRDALGVTWQLDTMVGRRCYCRCVARQRRAGWPV